MRSVGGASTAANLGARSHAMCRASILGVLAMALLMSFHAGQARANAPWWHLTTRAVPSNMPPGGEGKLIAVARNIGDADAQPPLTITDQLPPGLTVEKLTFVASSFSEGGYSFDLGPEGPLGGFLPLCTVQPHRVECMYIGAPYSEFFLPVRPYEWLEMTLTVKVAAGADPRTEENALSIAGGGAAGATAKMPVAISSQATQFGVERYKLAPEDDHGQPATQAGSHPFQLFTELSLNADNDQTKPPAAVKDLTISLPPGLIGNPSTVPQCTDTQLNTRVAAGLNACPPETAVGVAAVDVGLVALPGKYIVPLFNLVPARGEPARFGFQVNNVPVVLDTSVRTGEDYGVTVHINDISQLAAFLSSEVIFWGVPGDPRHDESRGWECMVPSLFPPSACAAAARPKALPFLTLPTSCPNPKSDPFTSTVEADSWPAPGKEAERAPAASSAFQSEDGQLLGMDGCNQLTFRPKIQVAPDVTHGSTPTGLTVEVKLPQDGALAPEGLAESTVKDTTVVLPEGLTVNPGGADGLEACSNGEIGFLPQESLGDDLRFTPESPGCPDGAKIGTVKITTPVLPNPLVGTLYLATQDANPFGSLLAMYIVAEDPVSGVRVKLPGEVMLDEHTGQLTATFKHTPQLPFESVELHFFGGSRAPLSTPPLCGSYATRASFLPWSGGEAAQVTSEPFDIDGGPKGAPCTNPQPFTPVFTAGSTNIRAGAFTPFTTTMSRLDGDQALGALSMRVPPGLLGLLSSVKLCQEPQASRGECGAESLIGHTVVSAGLGDNPVTVKTPGNVYITGPYDGAPFGLSIVNPTQAGPFDLGEVIVRAKINVDPLTAQLTVSTDPSGPFKIPSILKGIPLQLQHVNVMIDRPGFVFNPTNCGRLSVESTITSSEGLAARQSTPFQVTDCAALGFKPKLVARTSSRRSRAKGAELDVKLLYPRNAFGRMANVAKVKVDLPKQLPSRLSTLQKACPDSIFSRNPSECPRASVVGSARATTPVLPVSLQGPAYFVSHGSAKFPELVVVLQGYGITIELHGETFIKKGVTSSTFRQVPDVPVDTFELYLPRGVHSALAANGNLCRARLTMPTAFTAQNGTVIHQSTPIAVAGCNRRRAAGRRHGGPSGPHGISRKS